jgi:hypothetical protein
VPPYRFSEVIKKEEEKKRKQNFFMLQTVGF